MPKNTTKKPPVKPAKKAETTKASGKTAQPKAVPEPQKTSASSHAPVPSMASSNEAFSPSEAEIVLTDAEGRRYCKVKDCDQLANVESYCRFHYLLLWKRIQVRRKILMDGKLERFVEELTARYPDKFLEMIRKDLRTEKDFTAAMAELELDENGLDNDFDNDNNDSEFIDEVRSVGGATESGGMVDDNDY